MLPPGHLLVGYLPYSLARRLRGQRPTDTGALALAVGTQFPDLVDKTFRWIVPILPSGRSFGHSLLVFTVLAAGLLVLARRRERVREWTAFCFGVVSHQVVDAVDPVLQGAPQDARFLAWPLTSPVYYADDSLLAQIQSFDLSTLVVVDLAAGLLVIGLWIADGMPGLPRRRSE